MLPRLGFPGEEELIWPSAPSEKLVSSGSKGPLTATAGSLFDVTISAD